MELYNMIAEILIYVNIIGGLSAGLANLIYVIQNPNMEWGWIKWSYCAVGFYWSIIYSILLFIPEVNKLAFVSLYVRPTISIMATLMAVGAMRRIKPIYLPDIIRKQIRKMKKNRR
jgi:hypothetical protein